VIAFPAQADAQLISHWSQVSTCFVACVVFACPSQLQFSRTDRMAQSS